MPTTLDQIKIPTGLSAKGRKAAYAILRTLKAHKVDYISSVPNARLFYTPQEWRDRGEQYGTESELVVLYEEGDHRRFFAMGGEPADYRTHEAMRAALDVVGVYHEECNGWYGAVYPV